PSSAMRIRRRPPASTSTRRSVAPASSEFSSSSLTTEAGRSTTSPAAIWLATWSGRMRMRPMKKECSPHYNPRGSPARPKHERLMPLISWKDMQEVNVGIVGLGYVGSSTLAILSENGDQIALQLGYRLKVVA